LNSKKLGAILTGCYLALAASAVVYELSIRIYDRGNSEFAGMLSVALTLPLSLLLIWLGHAVFGVKPGDSDALFFVILSVFANVCIVWMCFRVLSSRSDNRKIDVKVS
jgi:hypothetical protein